MASLIRPEKSEIKWHNFAAKSLVLSPKAEVYAAKSSAGERVSLQIQTADAKRSGAISGSPSRRPETTATCTDARRQDCLRHAPAVKLDGTKIASLIPCKNFLSAGAIVASAPRNFTRSSSTK